MIYVYRGFTFADQAVFRQLIQFFERIIPSENFAARLREWDYLRKHLLRVVALLRMKYSSVPVPWPLDHFESEVMYSSMWSQY